MAPFFVRFIFSRHFYSLFFLLQVLASVGQPESANFVRVRVRAARTANSVDLGGAAPFFKSFLEFPWGDERTANIVRVRVRDLEAILKKYIKTIV